MKQISGPHLKGQLQGLHLVSTSGRHTCGPTPQQTAICWWLPALKSHRPCDPETLRIQMVPHLYCHVDRGMGLCVGHNQSMETWVPGRKGLEKTRTQPIVVATEERPTHHWLDQDILRRILCTGRECVLCLPRIFGHRKLLTVATFQDRSGRWGKASDF